MRRMMIIPSSRSQINTDYGLLAMVGLQVETHDQRESVASVANSDDRNWVYWVVKWTSELGKQLLIWRIKWFWLNVFGLARLATKISHQESWPVDWVWEVRKLSDRLASFYAILFSFDGFGCFFYQLSLSPSLVELVVACLHPPEKLRLPLQI